MEMKWQVISVHLCWDNIRCLPCPALWTDKTSVSRAVSQEPLWVGNVFQKTSAVEPPSGFLLCRYVLLCTTGFQYHPAKQFLPCNSLLDKSALDWWHVVYPWLFIFWRLKCRFRPDEALAFLSPSTWVTSSTKVTASQSGGVEMTSWNEFWLPGKYLLSMSNICPR